MTSLDLDPVFVKALKLLHSKNKDSAAQLKQLLDDCIVQKKGVPKGKVWARLIELSRNTFIIVSIKC